LSRFQKASRAGPLFVNHDASGGFGGLRSTAARKAATHGLPVDVLEAFQTGLGLTAQQTYDLAMIDRSQASRLRTAKRPLNESQSARVLRAMDLCARAVETFGTGEAAARWLGQPHPSFGGESPIQYGVSEFGLDDVRGVLAAIRYGGVA
jgi:putative toxin-antitoxin system antitoxin component (TIGR02293 family)